MSSKLDEIRSKLRNSIRAETQQEVSHLRERIRAETHQAIDSLAKQAPDSSGQQASSTEAHACGSCAKPLAGVGKFCPHCGAPQSSADSPRQGAARSMPATAPFVRGPESASPASQRNNLIAADIPSLPPRQGCKALCIGMGDYAQNALPWPQKDAQDLSQVLHGLGYQVSTIIDQGFKQTMTRLGHFIRSIEPGDDVVFTYSGHGCGIDAVPNLTALDTQGYDSLINVYKLMIETAKYQGARSVVIAVDACRDNNYEFAQYPWEGQQEALVGISKSGHVRRPEDEFGFAILYGTSHDTSAYDSPFSQGIQNGMFTYFLKSELTRPGQSLSEIFKRVQRSVMELSMGVNQFQKPALTNELPGEYYFYPSR